MSSIKETLKREQSIILATRRLTITKGSGISLGDIVCITPYPDNMPDLPEHDYSPERPQ